MKAGKGDAIEVILNVMRTHINNSEVCYAGCGALMNITYNNGKQIEAQTKRNYSKNIAAGNKVRAGKGGAIEVILNAMRTHINNAGVCEDGFRVLINITVNGKQIEARMK